MSTIRLNSVSKSFGGTRALNDITCDIPLGHVHGLIGRNGAGKTTLLRAIAGQVVTDGDITIGGDLVRDNQPVLDRIVLGGADIPFPPQMRVRTLLDIGASRWENWDDDFAAHLVDLFGLNKKAKFADLSRGQKTLVGNVIGLAASAEITLLDEPYLGLDVQNREALYRVLLDEIGSAPERTFIISTHHVEDAARLLDSVILLDEGRVTTVQDVETLTGDTVVVRGTTTAVDALLEQVRVPVLREDAAAGARRVVLDATGNLSMLKVAVDDLELSATTADLQETVLARGGGQ
ncbi:MAG TPA: ABC transporter ATP-binding protein [Candidatus Corynebacterium avicola]|uniref:ABC transporter ATP-binding protein n=1 Tax=Candidatus Corynebacterium avicola TaxID=2838527 RepID=A0A9D1RSF8_9CORY|nr:ABC transporter ATP-binding protein [Candidatus Corynebacterium avicola]